MTLLRKLFRAIRPAVCSHEFRLPDLRLTGIPEPERPASYSDRRAWEDYYNTIYGHPSVTKRVAWSCAKCHKIFYAHCGLDILSHGRPVPDVPRSC